MWTSRPTIAKERKHPLINLHIRKNTYYDSVALMLISKDLGQIPGVTEALVGMGTDLNKELSQNIGLDTPELASLTGNDFFVAADCADDAVWETVLARVEELLAAKKSSGGAEYSPATLSTAVKMMPGLNMAILSVPGQYAADVARDCLERDIHVMMFSDNVTIEDERSLKEFAVERGLLMMGPDCGTAIINGVPLAFANVVRRGNIGIVGASGTGTQEVSSLIDQLGAGVTQVIGTGGRDLKKGIDGLMFAQALDALIADADTEVIVLISKPPDAAIQKKILTEAAKSGKPTVVCFIGGDPAEAEKHGLCGACSLEEAAHKAVALSKGAAATTYDGFEMGEDAARALASAQPQGGQSIRGLYTGGTLCDEAAKLLAALGLTGKHSFIDYGDDQYTVGRPHPMIDPTLRNEALLEAAKDADTALILLDCVIGYGAHPDAAGELARTIAEAKAARDLPIIVSVCGTEGDPQGLAASREVLAEAGALVFPSNAQAVRFAKLVLDERGASCE